MENTKIDYLSNIPDELKLLIFSYLDTFDLIRLEEVSSTLQRLTYDKNLISTISLYKDYRCSVLHLQKIVLHKLRRDVVTSLNINCIHWVSRVDLKKCLTLPMLRCLYAVDTKLAIDDLVDLDLAHLHTLAVTFDTYFYSYSKLTILNNLKHLYIHYDAELWDLHVILSFIQYCCNLEELWLIDVSEEAYLTYGVINLVNRIPGTVRKIVLSYHGSRNQNLKKLNFEVQFFKTLQTKTHLCLAKDYNMANLYDESFYQMNNWKDYIVSLKYDYPFGFTDAQKLLFKECTFDDILWDELNLSHPSNKCSMLYRYLLDSIILTPNSKQLKKLSINMCSGCKCPQKYFEIEPLLKKGRVVHSAKSILQEIVVNSPFLEELEIWECEMVSKGLSKLRNNVLSSIKNLNRLQKLTLSGVPKFVSPTYLLDICRSCVNLTSLRISVHQEDASLSNYLCMSIPYAKSLKDLRFEHDLIPACRLVESFCEIQSPKLERLTLKCKDISTFDLQSFQKFLKHNPQLSFLCLCITKFSKSVLQNIAQHLNELRRDNQVFLVDSSLNHKIIPYHFKMEMVQCDTAVSTLDVFNGFVK